MSNSIKQLLFLILTSFVVISCNDNKIFHQNVNLNKQNWAKDSIHSFQFNIDDMSKLYDIHVNLRNGVEYPFQNLYIRYTLKDGSDNLLLSELLNLKLFNAVTGQPLGSGIGNIYSHQFMVLSNHQFEKKGDYVFDIQHYMRENELPHIISLGLEVSYQNQE